MKEKYFDNYVSTIFKQTHKLDNSEYLSLISDFDRYIYPYLPKDRDKWICDIGCGSGFFLYYLKQKKYKNICGVDISAEQIELCKKKGLHHDTSRHCYSGAIAGSIGFLSQYKRRHIPCNS